MGRHENAVASTLGFAKDPVTNGDFRLALKWLRVVEIVDGEISPEWEQARAQWRSELPGARRGQLTGTRNGAG
jgi:hypothetical protein